MLKYCVLVMPVWLSLIGAAAAADRYFYCDGAKAYYCERPAKYSDGCYVVRDDPKVIKVNGFPVVSSSGATAMMNSCSSSVIRTVSTHDPVAACCGCPSTGDCKCKNLSCQLRLSPPNCKKSGKTVKTPIPCEIYGTIPKDTEDYNCYEQVYNFDYETNVPKIMCSTQTCYEIGTKKLECKIEDCKPGCWFNVCVPINDCVTKTVECRLVKQAMPHIIYKRTDPNDNPRVSYDVYVINNPTPGASDHAGGMPSKWLVMHCATKSELGKRFPNMIASNKGKDVAPEATDADVNIELAIDEELLKAYLAESADEDSDPVDGQDLFDDKDQDLAEHEETRAAQSAEELPAQPEPSKAAVSESEAPKPASSLVG